MTLPGSPGYGAPQDPITTLVRRLEDLERTVRSMQTLLVNAGTLQVNDPNSGNRVFFVGEAGMNDGSGRMQAIVDIRRQDGTAALEMIDGGTAPGHTIEQALQWFDRAGNIVIADDTNGGIGLADPILSVGSFVDITSLASTTSASYVDLQWCAGIRLHPRVEASLLVQSTVAGTTGNVRIVDNAGSVIGTVAVTSLEFGQVSIGPVAWPAGWAWGEGMQTLKIQAERTAGTGTIGARCLGIWGVGS